MRLGSSIFAATLSVLTGLCHLAEGGVRTSTIIAGGFAFPVQVTHAGDGSDRLFVVEQTGRIRVIKSGAVLSTPFLDLSSSVTSGGERGLLGLAFHPDFAINGLFFVNYTDGNADTVVARFSVSSDPDVADPSSASAVLAVSQPFSNHNGGQLQFGPLDDYLYIGMGDGGDGNDPMGHGQNKFTLLGSLLRIDVDGGAPYVNPVDNPFVGVDGADEAWAIGLRNPWRFSFDRETGDLLLGDVGQGAWEEIDFQRAGTAGGVNFGWKDREGPCPRGDTMPCAPAPGSFTDPIAYHGRSEARSITGGFVYRGSQFPSLVGRYFYGDFITGRLWSVSRTGAESWTMPNPEGNLGFNISAFGEDEQGELYIVDYFGGTVRLLEDDGAPRAATTTLAVEAPSEGGAVDVPFTVSGWAVDPSSSTGTGVDTVQIWATPEGGGAVLLGNATYGGSRPDVGAFFGDTRYDDSGFTFDVTSLAAGRYTLTVSARSAVRSDFDAAKELTLVVGSDPLMNVEAPIGGSVQTLPFEVRGWAVDRSALTGTGVDQVQVWARPAGSATAIVLGDATYGQSRSDVASFFGRPNLRFSGFSFQTGAVLPAGNYTLEVRAHSTVAGAFNNTRSVPVTIVGRDHLAVDRPASGTGLGGRFDVSGWALNTGAVTGTGVDVIHVWAFPHSGAATFLGAATLGVSRPDVGAFFGEPRFDASGYTLTAGPLAPGGYTIRVYARNAASGVFSVWRDVGVSVVGSLPRVAVDSPAPGGVGLPFAVAGWAVDLNTSTGTGVDAVHVWATPLAGGNQIFLGAATLGVSRPDVAAFFGRPSFQTSGYALTVSSIPPGDYFLVVWMRSTVSGLFTNAPPRVIRVP